MEHKFLLELDDPLQYIELWNSEGFLEWFECRILDVTTNLLQWFNVLYPQ
jgi:hypothetical protein